MLLENKMADLKLLEQLKASRTSAKWQSSQLANNIVQMHAIMPEEELKDSFKKLIIEANKVMEANDDVEAQYLAEVELDADSDEVPGLSEQQKADIGKAADDEAKRDEGAHSKDTLGQLWRGGPDDGGQGCRGQSKECDFL